MTPVELLLSTLPHAKRNGKGWASRCPAHKDNRPSLSISEGDAGGALVHCHAGCTAEAITEALGLKLADLMPAKGVSMRTPRPATKPVPGSREVFTTAADAVAALERTHGPLAAMWAYYNADGEPVGVVVRWRLPNGGKEIRPVSRQGGAAAGWALRAMPDLRPLFHLPDLQARPNECVYVAEGEKCADALAALGLPATTSAGGAQAAGKTDWAHLAGRDVVVLPDADHAGEKYAADVAAALAKPTPPARVRLVRLRDAWPDLPDGGDIADIVEGGGDAEATKTKLAALVDGAEPETPVTCAPGVQPFKPFPTKVLPEPARSFVRSCARAIGCDESFIALPLLAALASAIGNTRRIQLKRGWSEPSILWVAVVGDSGTLKTPAFKAAMKALRKLQDEAFKEYATARTQWEADDLRYEAELTGWKRRAAKGNGDAGEPPEKPAVPIARRYIVSDATIEALAPILLGNSRGVLMARDELAGWIGSFDRYAKAGKAGGDSAHWLSMHNGESMTVDRKTGMPPTIHVPSASVSIAGGIQPGILARAMGAEHRESGLAARLLFACPPRQPKCWTEADISPDQELAITAVFERLHWLEPTTDDDGNAQPVKLCLSPNGKAAWVNFYNAHGKEQADLSGDLAAAWSKLEGYAARLALVVHLIRWAAGDSTLASADEIDADSIAAGVQLSRWFGNEARRAYAILSESDEDRARRGLVELIQRKGGTVTVRELQQTSRLFKTAAEVESALEALVDAGAGQWKQQGPSARGGRPTRTFHLTAPAPTTQPPGSDPPAPTKPPMAKPDSGFVGVDDVDTSKSDGGDWGEL